MLRTHPGEEMGSWVRGGDTLVGLQVSLAPHTTQPALQELEVRTEAKG